MTEPLRSLDVPSGVSVEMDDGRRIKLDDTLTYEGVDKDGRHVWAVRVPPGLTPVAVHVVELPGLTRVRVTGSRPKEIS